MNREIRFLIILFFVSAASMLAVNFIKFKEGHFPLTALNLFSMGLIAAWVALRLFFSPKKDSQMRTFSLFFFLFFLFVLTMSLSHFPLFTSHENHELFSKTMHWGYVIGHVFLYLSLAVFIRLPLQWIAPWLKNVGSAIFLLLGAVTTFLNILLPGFPDFNHATGTTLFNVSPFVGKLVALNVLLAWVPSGIYFISKAAKSKEKSVRWRALLLGSGLLVLTLGGPLHDISQKTIVFLLADIVVLAGIVILASGVMYHGENESQEVRH